MKSVTNRKTAVLLAIVACTAIGSQAQGDPVSTPASSATLIHQWQFGSESQQPASEVSGGGGPAEANVSPGAFAAGWLASDAVLSPAQGVWDLGSRGVITLRRAAGSGGADRLITVRVIQYQDGAIYDQLADVSVPGATRAGERTSQTAATRIGEWVEQETQWRLDEGQTADTIVITAAETGSLVDQVAVASPGAAGPSLSIRLAGPDKVEVSWVASGGDYVLESNTAINSADGWKPVDEAVQVAGDVHTVTTTRAGSCRFYRLKQP